MRRAAIFTAAFALAFATTDLQARYSLDDGLFSAGEDNAFNCIPFSEGPIDGVWYSPVSPIEEEISPTNFSNAQARFDAENREISIECRIQPGEDDYFALSNTLPPRRSGVEPIRLYRNHNYRDITSPLSPRVPVPCGLGGMAAPVTSSRAKQEPTVPRNEIRIHLSPFILAPSTQREPELVQRLQIRTCRKYNFHTVTVNDSDLLVRDEVQVVSRGFSPEYGDCLCGPINTHVGGECLRDGASADNHSAEYIWLPPSGCMPESLPGTVQSPSTERPNDPAPIIESAPAPKPTLE